MHVYLFYLIDSELSNLKYPSIFDKDIIVSNDKKCVLYAWTCQKKIKKEFVTQRNMKLFRCVTKQMSVDAYRQFTDDYSKLMLEYRRITTKIPFNKSYNHKIGSVCVLAPDSEIEFITSSGMDIISELCSNIYSRMTAKTPTIFKKKYQNAFETLSYELMVNDNDSPLELDLPWITHPVSIDWLGVYCKVFNNTYK